jgi:peptidoglycan/xylan/chitin deacetylase (PgdA/CDA1 family)
MTSEKKLKLGLSVVLCLLCVLIGRFLYQFYTDVKNVGTTKEMQDLSAAYQADKEIETALTVLQRGTTPADVISSRPGRLVLVFDGLPGRADTDRILKVLKQHDVKAVFFVEGQNAANEPEIMDHIRKAGHQIGNYTFYGSSHAEQLPQEDLVTQLCRTQKILATLTEFEPDYFRAPQTQFTPDLLKAVRAAGLKAAVQPGTIVNLWQIRSKADAEKAAAPLQAGMIVALETGKPVTELPKKRKPAIDYNKLIDHKPTVKDHAAGGNEPDLKLSEKVDFLLTALEARGIKPTGL